MAFMIGCFCLVNCASSPKTAAVEPKASATSKQEKETTKEGENVLLPAKNAQDDHQSQPNLSAKAPEPTKEPQSDHQTTLLEEVLREWEGTTALEAHTCWTGFECEGGITMPGELRDELESGVRSGWQNVPFHISSTATRVLLQEATRLSFEEEKIRTELSFVEKDAPFLLVDLPALLVSSRDEGERRRYLEKALPTLEERSRLDKKKWDRTVQVAQSVGKSVPDLYAMRLGLSPKVVTRAADEFLARTEEWVASRSPDPSLQPNDMKTSLDAISWESGLQGNLLNMDQADQLKLQKQIDAAACFLVDPPSDVRFVPAQIHSGASLLSTVYARTCVAAGKMTPPKKLSSSLFVDALSILSQELLSETVQSVDSFVASRLYFLRGLAILAGLSMDETKIEEAFSPQSLDTYVVKQLALSRDVPGSSYFLEFKPDGSHLDSLMAFFLAGAIDAILVESVGKDWNREPQKRDSVFTALKRVESTLREKGLAGVFEEARQKEVTAQPLLSLWRRLGATL